MRSAGWMTAGGLLWAGVALAQQAAPAQEDDVTAELREHHRHHHHGGVTHFIAMSLDTLGEDEAKRPQVEAIQAQLHVCTKPAHDRERALTTTLAEGVAAGAVDKAKVDVDLSQLHAAAASAHACSVTALNQLHDLLSPGERQALVGKVEAHWVVWRNVNHEAPPGGREAGGRLAELARELNLTADQQEKMSAALTTLVPARTGTFDPEQGRAHVQAFTGAFEQATFDAKTINANANGMLATHGARRMAAFYEAVAPLLTPDQRTTLASHLREHASHQPAVPAP
jgi:Spy/CpxP family protein refolding chaperone